MVQQLNWTEATQAICSIITVIITLVGLIFIIVQLTSAKKANQIATYENLYARMHDIHKFLYDHSELREYFYSSKKTNCDDANYVKVLIATEMFADFLQQVKLQSDLMPKKTAEGWNNYCTSINSRSVVLQEFIENNKKWYPSNFYQMRGRASAKESVNNS